ncbi:MAG TPA: efflux RND transporter periplasmic adaptor subunit [Xanthobacteraceae bacterium]|nr:efflux RND transporter periplasmic adaptor subunit [Xanthobacteraceae bacterium]
MTSRRNLITIVIAAVAIVGAFIAYSRMQQAQRNRVPVDIVPVVAAAAKLADVPVYLDGVGTTRALNTVTVRPQVDGKLIAVLFKEGQDVKRGDVLARIDPTPYQAQYDQVVATKAKDEAMLANAKIDLERYTNLASTNSIARQQLDTQKATVAQLEAQVKFDQGQIDYARSNLEYTTITAPLDGRTGIRLVDEGNVVHASDTTGIVVLTQISPMSIFFTLPQQQLSIVNKAFAKGPLAVDALGQDNKTVVDRGTLLVVDNQVDQTTGTVKLKAEFPNAEVQLWPGQFVNVRLLVDTLKQVVVVPTAAVQRGPVGTFVYVVQQDNAVAVRQVSISQQDETQTVIARGLAQNERVVTTGFARLAEGTKVTVTNAEDVPVYVPTMPSRRGARRGGEGGPRDGAQRGPQRNGGQSGARTNAPAGPSQ